MLSETHLRVIFYFYFYLHPRYLLGLTHSFHPRRSSAPYDREPIRLSYHNEVCQIAPEEVVPWSPLHRRPARAAPLLLAVGAEETAEFLRQHAEYAAAWEACGLRLGEVEMTGLHHFSAVDALGDRRHGLYAAVQQLLARGSA